ncbi:MAG: 30S ribosomal protein S20 [Alphaproteobacteria bacterium]|jgi:small subunit ribosomal protein S20|nr:30S ribosomal protein S20 [Rhodospirillaceae bacterium]MDG2482115.1 30S ribosomal protein S20 [Alphaproteobacteria bacterium]MBT6205538.1 30S ribosomal protein S20 [Rhodospirillaceae bacterium]MBT6509440.1 30S ribosomal protein S20 [Rhodospirillaceae bacterium]MBT7611609.1 30S ribosomal protein S20 [Rhodospirillaceae bacterium]
MANSMQAKKRVRQTARRTAINRNRVSRIRSYLRRVEEAITSGDKDAATLALRDAQPEIMRGAKSGLLHRNAASRKVSRLAQRVAKM